MFTHKKMNGDAHQIPSFTNFAEDCQAENIAVITEPYDQPSHVDTTSWQI